MFEKKAHRHITQILAIPSEGINLDLDFTVYDMLDFGGQPCETEPGFNQDACTETKLEKKSLEKFGCTTPFGTNKDRICQDYENGSKVMDMYRETMEENIDNCYSPCRVSKFVAENVFNKGIFYSTKYSTMNPTINDKEIFQILVKIDDFVQIMGKNLGFFKFRPKLMIFLKF